MFYCFRMTNNSVRLLLFCVLWWTIYSSLKECLADWAVIASVSSLC
jgi:hypothetical protein